MAESFLEKLKKSVLAGAHTTANKIEDAARTGKLHLDLMAERRKLTREFTELGKQAHSALAAGAMAGFSALPAVAEMQLNIAKYQRGISELEAKLGSSQRQPQ